MYAIYISITLSHINLDDVCGDVMKINLNDDEDGECHSKSAARNGYIQN